jgi:hypothetical protein
MWNPLLNVAKHQATAQSWVRTHGSCLELPYSNCTSHAGALQWTPLPQLARPHLLRMHPALRQALHCLLLC